MLGWATSNGVIFMWEDPHVWFLQGSGQKIDQSPSDREEKLIRYKTYLQALYYSYHSEDDHEVTE